MIEVIMKPGSVAVKGHANYAEPGKDIVCAAVSALTQTFILSMEELTSAEIKYVIEAGNAFVKWDKNLSVRAQVLIDSFFIGLKAIAGTYPRYVYIRPGE